ncbi:MAG: hypothetical protein JJU11_06840 [Candidatus Sumerlaeia bacterium]|nr:hypothetical protein [Candidatus Sumerlaeia bacterium]
MILHPSTDKGTDRMGVWRQAINLNCFAWIVFLLAWGHRLILHLSSEPRHLVSLMPDDSSYYFLVANHIASGVGSTFDGVNMTNGYHPLWMMVCTLLAWATGGGALDSVDGMVFYTRLALAVQMFLGLAAVLMLWVAVRPMTFLPPTSAAVIPLLFALPWQLYAMGDGLESALTLFFWAGLFYFLPRLKPFTGRPGGDDFAFGALLSIGFLARLDHALLCIAIAVVALMLQCSGRFPGDHGDGRRSWGGFLLKTSLWAFPVLMTAALYFAINHVYFDSMTPISGKLKSSLPEIGFQSQWLLTYPVSFLFGGVILLGVVLCRSTLMSHAELRLTLYCSAAFVVIHGLNTILFMHWAVHVWHFTGWYVPLAVVAAILVSRFPGGKFLTSGFFALAIGAILLNVLFLSGREARAFQARSFDAALWARENITDGRFIGMSDSGVFGAFRGGGVVNLDGVINNRAYQNALVESGLAHYLEESGVDFVAHHAVPLERVSPGYGTHEYTRRSHLHRESGGTILLHEQEELYRSDPFHDGRGEMVFVIWRYQPEYRYGRGVF